MSVAVIIVNYGQWELTRKCLDSLKDIAGPRISVTLVDNCSPGPEPSWVRDLTDVRYARLERNFGFAGGNNRGFELSKADEADFTFFLNNDAVILPGTIEGLGAFLSSNPSSGIAAPAIYRASDPGCLWSAGGNLNRLRMRYEQVPLDTVEEPSENVVEVDFVSGCALMIRTDLFREIGGFREDFFMYYEDADLCTKVRRRGFSVNVIPKERVLHEVASSSGGELSRLALYFSERNRIILSGEVLSLPTRTAFILYKLAVLIVLTVKFSCRNPNLIKWIWKGFLDGISARTGYAGVIEQLT